MIVQNEVLKSVKKAAPYAQDMITGWIMRGLLSNTYIVSGMKAAKFTFKNNDSMRFTATLTVKTGRNFDKNVVAKFIWVKTGRDWKATIKGLINA